jgi:hypothetical protein
MGLREVAEELYSATPAEFTASRNAAAGRADDKALAKEIRALRKPSASAAVVNSLVREKPDLVDSILEVGDRMRDAFAARDRDSIRSLTGDRQRLLQTAVRSVGDVSPAVQREIEETLQAAVIDPSAAAAVRSGFLTRALESTGVDEVDVSDAVALPIDGTAPPRKSSAEPGARTEGAKGGTRGSKAETPPAQPAESVADRRERERRIRTAEKALERAKAAADTLDDELDTEVDRRGDLEAEREELSRRLERTENELAESKAAERDLRRRITQAQSAVRSAEKDARAARER